MNNWKSTTPSIEKLPKLLLFNKVKKEKMEQSRALQSKAMR